MGLAVKLWGSYLHPRYALHNNCKQKTPSVLRGVNRRLFSSQKDEQQSIWAVDSSPRGLRRQQPLNAKAQEIVDERDFFLSVLGASTTKREAKSYLARYEPSKSTTVATDTSGHVDHHLHRLSIHVALIKIRSIDSTTDKTLEGLIRTFLQLKRLGLSCIITVASDTSGLEGSIRTKRDFVTAQADRVVAALESQSSTKACRFDDIFQITSHTEPSTPTIPVKGGADVVHPNLLKRPLLRGIVPVIPPIAFSPDPQQPQIVDADDLVLALTRELAGLNRLPTCNSEGSDPGPQAEIPEFCVDRIILLDPLGGIPCPGHTHKPHIFVNLEQEYDNVRQELVDAATLSTPSSPEHKAHRSDVGASSNQRKGRDHLRRHVSNLDLIRKSLAILPPTASALLTTPDEAVTLSSQERTEDDLGVITRRAKNPLIFNLLTDKPIVSSSLPTERVGARLDATSSAESHQDSATFIKKGMPVTIIPDPRVSLWKPPELGEGSISLHDAKVDFPRLLTLIEDSFNRPLDVEHYLNRIRNRIAGVIIAGEYEGGAILTWELPHGVPNDVSQERLVPYLDKFAVLKRSQGSGGVADIVFSAMVRSCFPEGVCWRSRKNNPVNKYYFERSEGTWKIPDTDWTMFWTTKGLTRDKQRWRDYESVCRTVVPSWANNKQIVD